MTGLKITLILRLLRRLKNVCLISTRITYLSNAERKGTESVVEWGVFSVNENGLLNSQFSGVFGRTYYLEMVRVDILTAIANYGVVSNTRLGWAGEGLTGATAQTSMLSSANV